VCVLVLPVSSVFNFKPEGTTFVGNVMATFIGIRGVNNVQLVFELNSECECISS